MVRGRNYCCLDYTIGLKSIMLFQTFHFTSDSLFLSQIIILSLNMFANLSQNFEEHFQPSDLLYGILRFEILTFTLYSLYESVQKRSLVSFLGAATVCKKPHVMQYWEKVERAQIFYASGFSIRTGCDAVMLMAEHSAQSTGKTFAINLSAPYVCQHLSDQLIELFPLVDIVFGNEEEALALAKALNWQVNMREKERAFVSYCF